MAEREQTRYADVASWELSDSMWERIAPLLPPRQPHYRGRGKHKRNVGGRPWVDARQAMSGILYVLRTGCPWKAVPRHFGTGSTIHRYFQNWTEAGVFEQMWQAGLSEYDDVIGIGWRWPGTPRFGGAAGPKWQAADGAHPLERGVHDESASSGPSRGHGLMPLRIRGNIADVPLPKG